MAFGWFERLRSRGKGKPPGPSAGKKDGEKSGDGHKPYSTDLPIDSVKADRFKRWPFAQRIATTIAKRTDPSSIVIGLYGPWGDGKTSTLKLMELALADHQHIVVVRFNPWHFGSQQQLLRGFFSTLAETLNRSLSTTTEKVGEAIEKYGSLLSIASMTLTSGLELGAGGAAEGIGRAMSSVELDELRERVENILRESGARVVVLIDDIDRLDRAEIHAIFKLVKLSASFDHTSYVLAFDDDMVSAALGEKYGGGGVSAGRNFLEKIVQVPLRLPQADELELRRVAFDGVDAALTIADIKLAPAQVQAFVRHFVDGLEPQLKTPRQAKLFGNALAFSLPLLKGEVNPVDQMLIEGIRLFYPKLYALIRDNPDMFLKSPDGQHAPQQRRQQVDAAIASSLDDDAGINKQRIRQFLEVLFPRIGNVGYGADFDGIWAKEQRVRSPDYFQRYFAYSVPPGDIGDREVDSLLEEVQAIESDYSSVDKLFQKAADERSLPKLILKLRRREDGVSADIARKLAMTIARNGQLLPVEEGMLSMGGTRQQGGILVLKLARRIPQGPDREQLGHDILHDAPYLPFAAECLTWLRASPEEQPIETVFGAQAEKLAFEIVADRTKARAGQNATYIEFGKDAPPLLWIWMRAHGKLEVSAKIQEWLDSAPEEVDNFLRVFVGLSWGLESGLSTPSDFDRSRYDSVAQLVGADYILTRLRDRYGAVLDHPQYHVDGAPTLEYRVAHQFAHIHQHVIAQNAAAAAAAAAAVQVEAPETAAGPAVVAAPMQKPRES